MRIEAHILKYFQHPLLIKYIDSFYDQEDKAYLVTELAETDLLKNMRERFKNKDWYSEEEINNIIL